MLLRNSFLVFMLILLSVSVFGVNCEENMQPLNSCQVITPTIFCDGYNVYFNNGSLFQSGNFSAYAEDTYYFNFSADIGEYLVILCDGTTDIFYVNYYNLSVFGQSFSWLAIIVIIGGISFVCLWISRLIKKEDLFLLKELLFFFGLLNTFFFVVLTLFISSGASITNFNNYFNIYVIIVISLLVFIIGYYAFITFKDLVLESFKKQ